MGPEWVGLIGNLIKIAQCDVVSVERITTGGESVLKSSLRLALRSMITLYFLLKKKKVTQHVLRKKEKLKCTMFYKEKKKLQLT